MMFKRKSNAQNLCVLRVSASVLSLEGVMLTDQNAASDYVRFLNPTERNDYIKFEWVFADDWTDSEQITQWRKASAKCAEVLIPHCVESEYIIGAYVGNTIAKEKLLKIGFRLDIEENKHIFFI